jgi:hypothetical protein
LVPLLLLLLLLLALNGCRQVGKLLLQFETE